MSRVLTDSSYFWDKVYLRLNHLPAKDKINVLDAFSGSGKIWKAIQKRTDKKIKILKIEKEKRKGIYLRGDNLKFLSVMDLTKFDVIDLDAYGVPFRQLEVVFEKAGDCLVFVTFCQARFGGIPKKMLNLIGYPNVMIGKCPTLFNKNGWEKMKQYLALRGVNKIFFRGDRNKHYFCFKLK